MATSMKMLLALEPRILFDGAALATGAEVAQDQIVQDQSHPQADTQTEASPEQLFNTDDSHTAWSTITARSDRREIIFIDTSVSDYQTFLSDLDPGIEAVLLDPNRDGLEQMAEILGERSDIDAIHIISHGNQAELWLGTGQLTLNSMDQEYAGELAVIGQALADTGDILIYGCNFGQGSLGQKAASRLAQLTGADVAASLDDTGSAGYGGDWDLEYRIGTIETQVALNAAMQQDWVGKLAVITIDTFADVVNGSDGVTSLREAILQVNAGSGGDTIVLGSGTYILSLGPSGDNNGNSGDLDILQSVTITGAGAQTTIIDGNGLDRVFHIQNNSTVVTMSEVTIQGGLANDNGAGVFVDNSSILNINDAILTNNNGMGGRGGAAHVHGTLNLNRVLISNNSAGEGGGMYFHGANGGTLTNVTISGNNASNEGGGLWTDIPISIMNSTIVFNTATSGAGVVDKDGMEITITNSILHNPAGQNSKNFLISGGNNIDSDGTAGLGDPLDGMDPMLATLANNGGPTQTHALQPGSPAINAGTATGAPAVDQRGVLRDANVDVGAYEVSSNLAPAVDLDANDSSGASGNDYAVTFTESDGPIGIADSDTDLTDADSTTFASVKLAVSGLLDGNAEELLLDGDTFQLATAVIGQDTSGGKYHVIMITGAGTATLTITKQGGGTFTELETEALIKAIQYQHMDANAPTNGNRLIDIIVNDGSADSPAARTTLNINPVNDPPALITNNPLSVPEESTRTITTAYLEATDVDNTATQLVYTLTQLPGGSGQVRLNGSNLNLGETFTQDDINNNRVTFKFSDEDENSVTTFKFTLSDGTFTSSDITFSINGQSVNDAPSLNGLDNTPTFTEGGAAVVLDNNATIADPELDAANNYNGATLMLVRNGGANAEDVFGGSGTLSPLVESGNLVVGITTIGTITNNSGGTLVLTFNSNATTALVNSVLQQITYANSSATPPASAQIDFTFNDGNTGSQGSGGALNATGAITINIIAINTAPTVDLDVDNSSGATGNDYSVTFTEGTGPIAIADSDTDLLDVDSTTFAEVKLTVSGLLDGNAEALLFDGDTFALATAVADQDTSGGNYHVIMTTGAGTATITITTQGGGTFTEVETETLIKAIQYQHMDSSVPTGGNRLVDVIVNDGAADSSAVRTTINVNPVNDSPGFSGLDKTPTFTEGGAAVVLDNNATIADPELDAANNYNGATLMLVRNGGANAEDVFGGRGTLSPLVESGSLVVGGTTIGTITNNSGGTLVLTFNSNATTPLVNSTLQQITYGNSSGNPPTSVQIDFTFSDGNAGNQGAGGALNDTGSITVSISTINNPPIAIPDSFVVNEGSSNSLNLANNDTDIDDGLDLTSIRIISGPTHGTIDRINTDGTVDYTHDGSEIVTDGFTYTIDDLSGAPSNTVTASLIVIPANDAPIIISDGGGSSATVSVTEGNTSVTQVKVSDAEGDTLIYSIIGGADAALFNIDSVTGVLTFITAPDFQAPTDMGSDNVYDVIVKVSDGTAADTQTIAVSVTNLPPVLISPPTPVPSPTSDPSPADRDTGTETPMEEVPAVVIPLGDSPAGPVTGISHGSTDNAAADSNVMIGQNSDKREDTDTQPQTERTGLMDVLTDVFDRLRQPFEQTVFTHEIRSLLARSEFLHDLDRVRDAINETMTTEKTYVASGVAAASGLSIGYVIWLLRSGVLLTALLSSVPAWQFVNPLLVLNSPVKNKGKNGQPDVGDDSLESMFENPSKSADTTETKGGMMPKAWKFIRSWHR